MAGIGFRLREIVTRNTFTEWVQLYVSHMAERLRALGALGALAAAMKTDETLRGFLTDYLSLLSGRR